MFVQVGVPESRERFTIDVDVIQYQEIPPFGFFVRSDRLPRQIYPTIEEMEGDLRKNCGSYALVPING